MAARCGLAQAADANGHGPSHPTDSCPGILMLWMEGKGEQERGGLQLMILELRVKRGKGCSINKGDAASDSGVKGL